MSSNPCKPRGWKKFALNHINAIREKTNEDSMFWIAYIAAEVVIGISPEKYLEEWRDY